MPCFKEWFSQVLRVTKKRRRKRRQKPYAATKPKICILLALSRKGLLAHTARLNIKRWKTIYQINTNQNKAEVATLISEKTSKKTARYI